MQESKIEAKYITTLLITIKIELFLAIVLSDSIRAHFDAFPFLFTGFLRPFPLLLFSPGAIFFFSSTNFYLFLNITHLFFFIYQFSILYSYYSLIYISYLHQHLKSTTFLSPIFILLFTIMHPPLIF